MGPGFGLSDSVGSLAKSARGLYRRASNSLAGQDFNRRAHDEAQRDPYAYVDEDLESDDEDHGEQQWSGVLRVSREDEDDDGNKDFAVKETPGKLQQLGHKLSEKGLAAASQAAGVSAEYLGYALKYVATETARDVGWLATCKTTTDTLLALKKRFPVLEDIKRAYEAGTEDGRRGSNTYRTHPPSPGITHPREVKAASNLDDRAIMSDSRIQTNTALHMGKRIYNPSIHAGLEEVSADPDDVYSDDDLQGVGKGSKKKQVGDDQDMEDIPIDDEQGVEDGPELSAIARHLLEMDEDAGDSKLHGRKQR